MKIELLVALYLGIWVGVGAMVAHFGEQNGVTTWVSAVATFVVFFFVNGTLGYPLRSRQLKREGKTPPGYANFMFQTQKINQPMQVPSLVRIALGLVVILGAALFVFAGGVFVVAAKRSRISGRWRYLPFVWSRFCIRWISRNPYEWKLGNIAP